MSWVGHRFIQGVGASLFALAVPLLVPSSNGQEAISVVGSQMTLATNAQIRDGSKTISLNLSLSDSVPFTQAALKQTTAAAKFGPSEKSPYFNVRFALPIPPDNDTNVTGSLLGLDENVWGHNHSPGLEVLPNGDVLAIYFSARVANGEAESANDTRFIQARLRHGADQWDPPELFFDFKGCNEQSGLLWREGDTIRFFGGGRGVSDLMPFKMATSTDNGATWVLSLPQLDKPAHDYTAQPIANAFRGSDNAIYFAMDAENDNSFLWRSGDGVHWQDVGGRTGARHSAIVPLDNKGGLLSIGGKNASVNGWTPQNISSDFGKTWSANEASAFPALGGNQRPSLIRLANGHLCLVTDGYHRKADKSPEGWAYGPGCAIAISTNNGASWHIKNLPVTLPHEKDRKNGTLGYATARQAPNGVIHVLATMTQPCLHYEFNEAWVFSEAGDTAPESTGGRLVQFADKYADGSPRVTWTARVCPNGRYLLDGREASFYANGKKEHEVNYASGRKMGEEMFWSQDGKKMWSWQHDVKTDRSTWTHYWPNGRRHIESIWDTKPEARDLKRRFSGLVADGPAKHWDADGKLEATYQFISGELRAEPKGVTNASR